AQVMDNGQQSLTAWLKEISLRSSVGESVQRVPGTDNDVHLRHEFVLPSRQYVDLICESDLQTGRTVFDPDSLTLSRTDDVR
ncbi:MAG TPA: hypothetical protein VJS65_14340, partial [Verrucomicrobiae bacterium]|nr:hypothetical protein [Verrucomicrobiae bacterium]